MDDLDQELDDLLGDQSGAGSPPAPTPPGGTPNVPEGYVMIPKKVVTKLREDRRTLREENEGLRKPATPPTPAPATPPANGAGDQKQMDKVVFAQQHRDLDWDDVETAFKLAAVNGVNPADALKDPLFVAYKEKKDTTRAAQQATPPPTNQAGSMIPADKTLKDMSTAEIKELQDKLVEKSRKNRQR